MIIYNYDNQYTKDLKKNILFFKMMTVKDQIIKLNFLKPLKTIKIIKHFKTITIFKINKKYF